MNFSLISRVPGKRALERQTDGQKSDPIRVPFLSFKVQNPKN